MVEKKEKMDKRDSIIRGGMGRKREVVEEEKLTYDDTVPGGFVHFWFSRRILYHIEKKKTHRMTPPVSVCPISSFCFLFPTFCSFFLCSCVCLDGDCLSGILAMGERSKRGAKKRKRERFRNWNTAL